MSTLVTNNRLLRHFRLTYQTYFILACLTYIFSYVYHLFGHGQSSLVMQTAFISPLLVAIYYFFIYRSKPLLKSVKDSYRLAFNMLGSGVATLVVAQLIQGVLEIAGTSSIYLAIFYMVGLLLTLIGAVLCVLSLITARKA